MQLRIEIRQLIKLAWPLLIAQVTQILMGVSDTIMAGRVSATDMAAVAIASSIIIPILLFLQGIVLALPPIISRYNGAKQAQLIPEAVQQTAWLMLLLSVPLACCYPLVPYLLSHIGMDPDLKRITGEYLQYMLLGSPAFALYQVLRNYCEGLSLTRPSMVIMVIGLLVNIPANYILIYGKFGMPAYGGAGCGIATATVYGVMFVATLLYTVYAKKLADFHLYRQLYRPDWRGIWSVVTQGVPIAMAMLFEVSLFATVALLLSPFGAKVVASHQIALNFSALMFMVPLSIGMAATIRVGQLLGEGRPKQASLAIRGAWLTGMFTATCTASVSFILRYPIARLYSHNPEVIDMAADLMLLAAMFQFSDAMQVISGCALRGYKDSKAMFYITFVSYWLVGLSCGCILGLTDWIVPKMAAPGFWIGFIVGLTTAAIFLSWRLLVIQHRHNQPA